MSGRASGAAAAARAQRALLVLLLAAVAAAGIVAGGAAAPVASAAEPPPVSAPSAIVTDADTGRILWSRAARRKRSIASTTKLMTALLTLEREKLADVVPAAGYDALPVESQINLAPGERMTVADLLRALLLESANDAAVTLAEAVSGSRPAFVRAMNRRARQLGLEDTRYANPIGLDDANNYSSARDLARLTLELRRNAFFRSTVNRASVTLRSGARPRTIANRNDLVAREPWIDGVKTGHTLQAGYVLVGEGRGGSGAKVISVVLGTDSEAARDADSLTLLRWGRRQFKRVRAVTLGDVMESVPIRYRRGAEVDLVAGRTVRMTVLRRQRVSSRLVGVPREVSGPLRRGQRVADIEVLVDGKRARTVPLVTAAAVPEAGLTQQTKDWFTRPWLLGLVVAALLGSVLLTRLRRRRPRSGRTPRREAETAP